MTIHFHGSPITGGKGNILAMAAYTNGGAFVSFAHPQQIELAFEVANSVCIDNGAFSKKNSGRDTDWHKFYNSFLPRFIERDKLRFFVIPDDISGNDKENDRLIAELPRNLRHKGAPVWHMHESLDRLVHLANEWEYVCIGSSGEYYSIRSEKWKRRMNDAFDTLIQKGYTAKIHGLRMLDGRVLGNYPLDQADSTNLAINAPKWICKYVDMTIEACRAQTHRDAWVATSDPKVALEQLIADGGTKEQMLAQRCAILRNCIEAVRPPSKDSWNSTFC